MDAAFYFVSFELPRTGVSRSYLRSLRSSRVNIRVRVVCDWSCMKSLSSLPPPAPENGAVLQLKGQNTPVFVHID